jgi:hypothetical protein
VSRAIAPHRDVELLCCRSPLDWCPLPTGYPGSLQRRDVTEFESDVLLIPSFPCFTASCDSSDVLESASNVLLIPSISCLTTSCDRSAHHAEHFVCAILYAAVMEYQIGLFHMCKTIQLTGTSLFIYIFCFVIAEVESAQSRPRVLLTFSPLVVFFLKLPNHNDRYERKRPEPSRGERSKSPHGSRPASGGSQPDWLSRDAEETFYSLDSGRPQSVC